MMMLVVRLVEVERGGDDVGVVGGGVLRPNPISTPSPYPFPFPLPLPLQNKGEG